MNARRAHPARRLWMAVTAALFVAALAIAPRAQANTGAGGTILNTVTVNYRDVSGTQAYSASATTSVTINLVKAALTYSGRPTGANAGATAPLPAGQTVNSGATADYIIALTANANGGDTYSLSETTGTLTNINTSSVTWATLQNDGSTVLTGGNPASVNLGASVIISHTANTISIPGGSTLVAAIQTNTLGHKVIVVGGVDYIVSNITTGAAPANSNVGNTWYNNTGTATAESLAVITLAANPSGSNTTPALTNAVDATVAAEQILVRVSVTATTGATPGTDGQLPFHLTTTSSGGGNSTNTADITTTFRASNLQVRKTVRNCGNSAVGTCGATAYAASATGNPGDVLEYRVEVNNAGVSNATSVTAQDAVPAYTTLITFIGAYGDGGTAGSGAATNNFASLNSGATTVALTMQSSDTESGGAVGVGAGDAAGTTASSAIHFFLGTSATNAAGGTIAGSATYTILYRVKVQ